MFFFTNRVSKAHLSITFSGTPVKEPSGTTHESSLFLLIYKAFAGMSFIKQKRGSKWNKLSKRSTKQEN